MAPPEWVNWKTALRERDAAKWDRFSWLTLRALLSSWNHVIGSGAPRLVHDLRGRWVAARRNAPGAGDWSEDLVIPMRDARSFLVLGDPGEQDASQYVLVGPLLTQGDADFMVVCSDVIYPGGDVNDYVDGFYRPYQHFKQPIFGLPGNHDWYDGLNGFMWNFCGLEALSRDDYSASSYSTRERIAQLLWRKASKPDRDRLTEWRNARAPAGEQWTPVQPGPYWAIETDELLVVGIDTGIKGDTLDREQGDWLVRVSTVSKKPKVLLTGKPLLVDFELHECEILDPEGGPKAPYRTVQELVRDPARGYVAVIGGDIHNYQHYETEVGRKGRLDYFVSGGAGAYMSATHSIPRCEPPDPAPGCEPIAGVRVKRFTSYPPRDRSLVFFGGLLVPRIWRLVLNLSLLLGGFGVGAAAALWFDVGDGTLRTVLALIAAASGAVGFLLAAGVGHPTRTHVPGWRRPVVMLLSFAGGAVLALTGWWLTGERFGWCAGVAGGLAAGGAVVATFLRHRGRTWWASWKAKAVIYGAQAVGALAAVIWLAAPESARGAVVAVIVAVLALPLAIAVNVLLRKLPAVGERLRPLSLPIGALLTGLATWGAIAVVDGDDETNAAATAILTLVAAVAIPIGLDQARQIFDKATPYVIGFLLLAVVAGAIVASPHHWAPEAAVAAVAVVTTATIGIAIAHLAFLGAFDLLLSPSTRCGNLNEREAREALAHRDGGPRPASPRVRRVLQLVHPASDKPRGPLQSKVSEIADNDDPPFFKHFLRLDVKGRTLTVRCFGVTGAEKGRDDVKAVDEVEITLPG